MNAPEKVAAVLAAVSAAATWAFVRLASKAPLLDESLAPVDAPEPARTEVRVAGTDAAWAMAFGEDAETALCFYDGLSPAPKEI